MKLISSATKPSVNAVTFKSVNQYEALVNSIVDLFPREGSVLHVGCGNGGLAGRLASILPGLRFRGVERYVCKGSQVPIHGFNGLEIPFGDNSFDSVLIVDGLQDAESSRKLLKEAARVARDRIILKDRSSRGLLASTRRLMDRSGVGQPISRAGGRLSKSEFHNMFAELGLSIEHWDSELRRLNSRSSNWIFSRSAHFAARLGVSQLSWA